MLRSVLCLVGALILFTSLASTQPSTKPLEFEVASIKPADPGAHVDNLYTDRGAGLHEENFPLRYIITFAYDIRDFQLANAPAWIGTERYDIVAKIAAAGAMPDPKTMSDQESGLADRQLRERIRALLANRFGLAVHHEYREQSVYALTVSKSGPKLSAATAGDQYGFRGGRGGQSQGFGITMTMFANELARITERPVIDKTALNGKYDYVLNWTPDLAAARPDGTPPPDNAGPTIFTALQE